MKKESCETCKYFIDDEDENTAWGYCRRFPPVLVKEEHFPMPPQFAYPSTTTVDWCGEYERTNQTSATYSRKELED